MEATQQSFYADAVEYVGLLERLGADERASSEFRKRSHQRFDFNSPEKTILIQIGDDVGSLCNLSVGGISFFSRKFHETEKKFGLYFDGRYQVDILVVNATPVFADPDDGEVYYQHQARFFHESDGYDCTLAVLKYYLEIEKFKF